MQKRPEKGFGIADHSGVKNLQSRFGVIHRSMLLVFSFSPADFPFSVVSLYLAEPSSAENMPADVEKGSNVTAKNDDSITRLKRAAATAISAAAVKAKLLAEQEEDQIRRLAALVVEKLVPQKIYSIDR